MTDNRYERVTFRGKTVDRYTMAALLVAEQRLGYELTIVQGSYNKGVGASAGTHDGGGAVDLAPFDWQRKVRVLREIGFAAWHRPAISGLWGEHIHAVLLGNEKASAAAKDQMSDYRLGRDGLKGDRKDPDPWRPNPIPVFQYDATPPPTVKPLKAVGADFAHHFTGNILWQIARNNGLRFIVHKVTEGATVADPAYRKRRAEGDAFNAGLSKLGRLLGRGIRQGGYHYASPDGPRVDDAVKEADWFLKHLVVGNYDVAPWLDFEELNGLTLAQADQWCLKWMARVKAAGIERIGLYTNFDLPLAAKAADFVIRARYSNNNDLPVFHGGPNDGKPAPFDVRQFSNGDFGNPVRVPGFGTGKVDLNAFRKGFRVRDMRLKGGTKQPPVPPTPDPEPTPVPPTPDTTVRIGTRNVRGTRARDFDLPADRATYAIREANENGVTVVALQELSTPQVERITSDAHPRWAIHVATPNIVRRNGVSSGSGIMRRKDQWISEERTELKVTFDFPIKPAPFVIPKVLYFPVEKLTHQETSRKVTVIGVHLPAGKGAQITRARNVCVNAVRLYIDSHPDEDVVIAGDMNGKSFATLSNVSHRVDRIASTTLTLTAPKVTAGWDDNGQVRKVSDHFGLSGEVEL